MLILTALTDVVEEHRAAIRTKSPVINQISHVTIWSGTVRQRLIYRIKGSIDVPLRGLLIV